jgi:hypothetical protein
VAYEDGVATAIAYDGWKHGDRAVHAGGAARGVGLVLPEPGTLTSPQPTA